MHVVAAQLTGIAGAPNGVPVSLHTPVTIWCTHCLCKGPCPIERILLLLKALSLPVSALWHAPAVEMMLCGLQSDAWGFAVSASPVCASSRMIIMLSALRSGNVPCTNCVSVHGILRCSCKCV